MTTPKLLERAFSIAVEAHRGQLDRYGAPYILHPLRVMNRVVSTEDKIVAILHDVVEDTDWTFARLKKEGFSRTTLAGLDGVTRRYHEPYEKFVRRTAKNATACRVKLADLEDNMDVRRMPRLDEDALERLKKYHWAWNFLKNQVSIKQPVSWAKCGFSML